MRAAGFGGFAAIWGFGDWCCSESWDRGRRCRGTWALGRGSSETRGVQGRGSSAVRAGFGGGCRETQRLGGWPQWDPRFGGCSETRGFVAEGLQ